MKEPLWLERKAVLTIHEAQIREHGGGYGVRDEGLLESALARPIQLFNYGENPDLFQLAAAYGFGVAKNHPFVDGNKRTAFQCMFVFLYVNNIEINATEVDAVITMLGAADGSIGEKQLADWLRVNHQKVK
ncbi:MAG: type II toxin-antitoxin system death-on-curing family toxin [Turneriella sp.]